MKGSRSKGTKAEPVCSCCDKRGHYASACPVLAKQVLAALGKTHSSAQIKKIVAKNTSLKLQDFHGKNVKTGKRASGNRSLRGPVASAAGAASKAQKGRSAKKKNKEREQKRRPRAQKQKGKQPKVGARSVAGAFASLVFASAEAPGPSLVLHIASNAALAANSCAVKIAYKDVLAWSHLPQVRMSLPCVQRALELYFGQTPPPSVDHIGLQLGLSGKNTGSLKKLLSSCQTMR